MLRFLPLKVGRLYRCLKLLLVVGLFVILLMNTHSLFASFQKNELTDRRFINLNKCPACFGTSWCRKFMNGQVSFETWGRLRFLDVFNVKNVYFAQYGEPREGTRRVVLKRLGSNQELAEIDQKICKRATGRPRCDLIQAMYKTEFARINGDVRLLTPEVVEGWSDLVHCPSQRLLDRVVRRYAETKDSGSFLLKNLKDTERMQLLMTLAFNPEPLVLQLSHYLDVVEVSIARQISLRSDAFFHAMSSQHDLQDRLQDTQRAVAVLRGRIAAIDRVTVQGPLRALRTNLTRNNCVKLHNKLKLMAAVHQTQPTVQLLLSTAEFMGALELISTTKEVLQQELQGVHSFRHLGSQLCELEKLIDKMMVEDFSMYARSDLNRCLRDEPHVLEKVPPKHS
ncbi:deleted in autism protein 1 homolog [Notothenia coriiceps]|uniref:Deleted in autism protein 1 homolog n=1 Tax=Notothenia coriiceps TaxID=8208 RepID=A0A6I9NZZ4_9TELE|nr:PREDICTED: deleted in autism protein 1 homolog [Notothenia coriiceps]